MLSDILVMTRDCPSVRILKYPTILEKNPQWKEMEQRAGGSRVGSPDDEEERVPLTQHSWHVSAAPMSKICYPRVSRWEIFTPIPRLGYMLRVAREIGLPGVCSQGRLDSADSHLQRPVTHCSTAARQITQLTLITDNKQMCLRLSSFCTLSWLYTDPG